MQALFCLGYGSGHSSHLQSAAILPSKCIRAFPGSLQEPKYLAVSALAVARLCIGLYGAFFAANHTAPSTMLGRTPLLQW